MNSVNLIGRLTRDPESVQTAGGTDITNLRVAINGRKKDETTYVDVKLFNGTANAAATYLERGQEVYVTGRLVTDEWEDAASGDKRSKLYVIANDVTFGRKANGNGEGADQPEAEPAAA